MVFLNKNNPDDYQRLIRLISSCAIELLPTLAECAGIAFAEAAAYGLPVFTHDTGGVANYVIDNITGHRLPVGSSGADFGRTIAKSIKSEKLSKMAENAKQLYNERLNWDVWRCRVNDVINNLLFK